MSRHELDAGTRPITTDYRWNSYGRIIDVGGAYVSLWSHLPFWLLFLVVIVRNDASVNVINPPAF